MKIPNLTALLVALGTAGSMSAQVYYSEDFENLTTETATAAGWEFGQNATATETGTEFVVAPPYATADPATGEGGSPGGDFTDADGVSLLNPPTVNGINSTGKYLISDSDKAGGSDDIGSEAEFWAITPSFSTMGSSSAWFHANAEIESNNNGEGVALLSVSTDGGTTWTQIWALIEPQRPIKGFNHDPQIEGSEFTDGYPVVGSASTTKTWNGIHGRWHVELPAAANNQADVRLRMAFYEPADAWWYAVDDILVNNSTPPQGSVTVMTEDFEGGIPSTWGNSALGQIDKITWSTEPRRDSDGFLWKIIGDDGVHVDILRQAELMRDGGFDIPDDALKSLNLAAFEASPDLDQLHPNALLDGRFVTMLAGGNYAMWQPFFEEDEASDLDTPSLDLSDATEAFLDFDSEMLHRSDTGKYEVQLSVDGGSSFETIFTYQGALMDRGEAAYFNHHYIPIPSAAGSGSVIVRFHAEGADPERFEGFWVIDNIRISKNTEASPGGGEGGGNTGGDGGLVGHWPIEAGSGESLANSVEGGAAGQISNSNNGLGDGGSVWVNDSERGTVLGFDGTAESAYVRAGDIPVMTLENDFTWSFWANQDEGNTTPNNIILGNRKDGTATDFVPRQFIKFTPTQFEWHMNGNGNDNLDYDDIAADVWIHHTVVKQGSQVTYYRDGAVASEGSISQALDAAQPLFFGGDNEGSAGENWRGLIDEIMTYDKALSGAEVAELATPPAVTPGGGGGPTGSGLAFNDTLPAQISEGRIVDDTILFDTGENNLDNWEPFSSVVGNSTFVIEANSFADGSTENQRYRVAFQSVIGGAVVEGEGFFGDDGTPYLGQINGSRQNGNPGRVAGDRRPGASNFIVGGEASPHLYPEFQTESRWNTGFDRLGDGRYGAAQIFSLNPTSLEQTPLSNALDAVNGRLTSGAAPGSQTGRFGGDLAVLDNGNFVVVVDDRSQVREGSNSSTAVILAPDGSVVKESWVVDPRDIWSNVSSYQGGFAVRVHDTIYFHANDGNETGNVVHNDDLPLDIAFDNGRGDGTRMASHINSPYVFVAGAMPLLDEFADVVLDEFDEPVSGVVRVAVWDSRDNSYVTQINVTELTEENGGTDSKNFFPTLSRVNLAVDALNRVAVGYGATPLDSDGFPFEQPQTMLRVLAFDGVELSYLTPSFFAFVNQSNLEIRTFRPSVSMTTKEILVAAKGEINSSNTPDQGADTPTQTTFYSVISHPDPQEDPTTPLTTEAPSIGIQLNADGSITVTFEGTLESAPTINGPWSVVAAPSPLTLPPDQPMQYARAVR